MRAPREQRPHKREWQRKNWGDVSLFTIGFLLCAAILVVTSVEKFAEGGWVTLVVTALLVSVFVAIKIGRAHV